MHDQVINKNLLTFTTARLNKLTIKQADVLKLLPRHESSISSAQENATVVKDKYVQFELTIKDKSYLSCKNVMDQVATILNEVTNRLNNLTKKHQETHDKVKAAVPQMDQDYTKISRLEKSLKKVSNLINGAKGELGKRSAEQS